MRVVTANLSDVKAAGRLDAGFHVVSQQYAEQFSRAREAYTPEQARQILDSLKITSDRFDDLCALDSGQGRCDRQRVMRKYPIESLAIISAHADELVSSIEESIERQRQVVQHIQSVRQKIASKTDSQEPQQ